MNGRQVHQLMSQPRRQICFKRAIRVLSVPAAAGGDSFSIRSRHPTAEASFSGASQQAGRRSPQLVASQVAENLAGPSRLPRPESESGFTALPWLPWLTADQSAERQKLDGRLAALWDRPDVPWNLKSELYNGTGAVFRTEQDILRADALLKRMSTRLLSEDEWRELRQLVERAKASMPFCRGEAMTALDTLAEGDALTVAEATLLKNSLQQLIDAHGYLTSDRLPWQQVARCVKISLRTGTPMTAVVESRVIPGSAFGDYFFGGYRWDRQAGVFEKALSKHVPDLAQTTLTNARGQTLFSGLRHGFAHHPELTGRLLMRLSDGQLKTAVDGLDVSKGVNETEQDYQSRISAHCEEIRGCQTLAEVRAGGMRSTLSEQMVEETVAAALVADPYKLQRALCGARVRLNLFSIALLTPDELDTWVHQRALYNEMARQQVVKLKLRGRDGAQQDVYTEVQVRQFALLVDGCRDASPAIRSSGAEVRRFNVVSAPAVEKLLAPRGLANRACDATASVYALNARIVTIGAELDALERQCRDTVQHRGGNHRHALEMSNSLSTLKDERALLAKRGRTLQVVAEQLASVWKYAGGWPAGDDALKAVGARLALIGYLMGETPLLSCSTSSDLTRKLDAEVKILATIADVQDGFLPPVQADTATWEQARAALAEP